MSSNMPVPRAQTGLQTGRILQTTLSVAVLLATLFTGFTPAFLTDNLNDRFSLLLTPQPQVFQAEPTTQRSLRIGIVSGHWGNDAGAVCEDGTTEADVNLTIAMLVQQRLMAQGFQVDLLKEFDTRLDGYQGAALVSIHNDSCLYVNPQATGFKIAAAVGNRDPNLTNRLSACLRDRYTQSTGLSFHSGSITLDMTDYHAFNEIDPSTAAVIIETGFLNLDYAILTQRPDLVAEGIVNGILCYVNNESLSTPNVVP
ncbi:MAG: N-acetylmuramoyl-L-alanine amidase [Chloroflexota bacterium]